MSQDMQLKWKINQMDCYPEFSGEADYVFNVHWDCLSYYNGPSGGPYYGRTYGVTSVPSSPGPFIPYPDLKEDQVFSWVYTAMPSGDKEKFENAAIQQIINQINPPVVTPPNPWPADVFPIIAPFITIQPQKQMTLWSGQSAYVSVGVGGQPIAYQWRKDSVNLPQETGAGLQISNIQLDQAGNYDVVVSNSLGTATSSGCNIVVDPPVSPVIVDQPKGGQIMSGSNFGMSVLATGYPSPSYQWNFNGAEISGANQQSYFIYSGTDINAGDYTVKVYNAAGQVISDPAHVEFTSPQPISGSV